MPHNSDTEIVADMVEKAKADERAHNATLGPKRIVAITTNGGNREDGNIYYTWHYVVESDTLNFDEPIFDDPDNATLAQLGLIDPVDGYGGDALSKVADHIRSLGYIVHEIPTHIITLGDDV